MTEGFKMLLNVLEKIDSGKQYIPHCRIETKKVPAYKDISITIHVYELPQNRQIDEIYLSNTYKITSEEEKAIAIKDAEERAMYNLIKYCIK